VRWALLTASTFTALVIMSTLGLQTARGFAGNPENIKLIGVIGNEGVGALARAGAVAVDQSTRNVWVDDINGQRVMEYEPSGQLLLVIGGQVNKTRTREIEEKHEPLTVREEEEENLCTVESGDECGEGTPGTGPGEFNIPSGIAVYHNPSETAQAAGEVYVGDAGNDRIEKFDTAGRYLMTIARSAHGNPTFYLPEYNPGLAAESNGDILALDWETEGIEGSPGRVLQFDPSGALTSLSYGPKLFGTNELRKSAGVAVDEQGTVYVGRVRELVVRFSASGRPEAELAGTDNGYVVGVDPRAGDLFVAAPAGREHVVAEFSPGGVEVASFESVVSSLGMGYGVAEGRLYVSDAGVGRVSVFGVFPVPVAGAPSVLGESVSGLSQGFAMLGARIDPNVVDTKYWFEYGTEAGALPAGREAVGGSRTSVVDAGNGYSVMGVNAGIALQPSTVYYYRVVAQSGFGGGSTVYGPTESFTSPAVPPSAVTGGASGVSQESAVVGGVVTPGSVGAASDTRWCFQYGTSTGYKQASVPVSAGDAGQGTGEVPVSVELSHLWPGRVYHYRLVAVNSLGLGLGTEVCGTAGGVQSDGADGTFTTSVAGPPGVLTGGVSELVGAANGYTARVSGFVDGRGAATTYEFDVGSDTSYGARIFGDEGSSTGPQEVSAVVQGLQPGRTYHYRLAASDAYGASDGADALLVVPEVSSGITPPVAPPLLGTPVLRFPGELPEKKPPSKKPGKKHRKKPVRHRHSAKKRSVKRGG
jgi:hypothetical protein